MAKRKAATKKKGSTTNPSSSDNNEQKAKIPKTTSTSCAQNNKIDIKAILTLSKSIINAYQSTTTNKGSGSNNNKKGAYQLLNEHNDNGTIEQTLWPYFLHCATSNGEGIVSSDIKGGEEIAYALIVLSNLRSSSSTSLGGDNSGGADLQLSFVVDDYNYSLSTSEEESTIISPPENITPKQRTLAFAILLKLLMKYQELHSTESSIAIQTEIIKFYIASYSSMELRCKSTNSSESTPSNRGIIEGPLTDLVGIRLLSNIFTRKRTLELKRNGMLRKRYGLFESKQLQKSVGDGEEKKNVSGFLPGLVDGLLNSVAILGSDNDDNDEDMTDSDNSQQSKQQLRKYTSKALELLNDLMSYPQTRTHVAPYLSSKQLVVCLLMSKLYKYDKNEANVLIRQQIDMLVDSERMEVVATSSSSDGDNIANDISNSSEQVVHARAHTLQKLLHRHYQNECSEVIYAGVQRVTNSHWLSKQIDLWNLDVLYDVCYRLRLVDDNDTTATKTTEQLSELLGCTRRQLLSSILVYHLSTRATDSELLSMSSLYPTESLLWDAHSLPPSKGGITNDSLSLPKLNTRFLSASDYLLRNFRLFRLESAYEIRGDIVDDVKRMKPSRTTDGYAQDSMVDYYGQQDVDMTDGESKTTFQGWARMGLELGSKKKEKPGLRLIRVDPPRLGERVPSQVIAEIVLDLHSCATSLAKEWDEIGEHDNLFLVSVDATQMTGDAAPLTGIMGKDGEERRVPDEEDCTFPQRYGVNAVRGCMVLEVKDESGVVLSDPALTYAEGGRPEPKGKLRFLRVALDPAQYAADATGRGSPLGVDMYETFNLVVRRHGRENNFKAVLETLRGLMQGGANSMYRSIPSWLMPVILGYGGDPTMASFTSPKMIAFASQTTGVTSPDAPLDYGDTFLDGNHLKDSFEGCELIVDGKAITNVDAKLVDERKKYRVKVVDDKVEATSYPFPSSYAGNDIRFTPVQVNAIRSGLSPGLTTIIGPPGTGKTDVAVQIIANLYHSFPTQRTVIVTHSNTALNDIFDKVMARGDVDERYMLRLGSGEKNLTTESSSDHDFTKTGRVAHIMSRRGDLLESVQQLSESLGVSGKAERGVDGSPSYTCETAEYFFFHHAKKHIDIFEASSAKEGDGANVIGTFPFTRYFPELTNESASLSLEQASKLIGRIKAVFGELAEYRPIELLRSQRQRTDYLLTKQARIVAMTCTHAAIARAYLVKLGFHYDNIIMEEAAQMLDCETFVPLLLQSGESDSTSAGAHSRLKRVCLIGDHNQLPPVVKNQSFSRYSHYDQSLFSRLVRLGVPSIELNKQGRARPDIARLYSWRYDNLGDLGHVSTKEAFTKANTGLVHTFQLINVEDFEGRGESTPTAYFYQNVAEAEYCVALFQYMVLIGYDPKKISIITTYNGQVALIKDILSQRCGGGTPLAGVSPGAVSTVDQYQGQQNDYIILSLVRTKTVGHVRDIRRLVVAVSRARLGLYVFGRSSLFCNCHELRRTMDQFAARPSKLQLVKGEHFPTDRMVDEEVNKAKYEMNDVSELGSLVHSMQQELA